jgi:spermidine synthase
MDGREMKKHINIFLILYVFFALNFIVDIRYVSAGTTDAVKKESIADTITYPEITPHSTLSFPSAFNDKVIVIDDGEYRSLKFGSVDASGTQSKVDLKDPGKLLFDYSICSALGFSLFKEPKNEVKNVLMIGLGGGSFPRFIRKYFPEAKIDSVDIDPVVAGVARKYFFVQDEACHAIYVEDGRKFVETSKKTYDVVILDAFGNGSEVPRQLTSMEFLAQVKKHLSPKGIIITNFINRDQALYESILATYGSAFKYVMRFNLLKFSKSNVVIFSFNDGSKNLKQEEFLKRVDAFSKYLNQEYELRKYAILRDSDLLVETHTEVIHDR